MPETPPTESENLQALLLNPANVILAHLAKNPIAFDADQLQLTDFIECDFLGYAPILVNDWVSVESDEEAYGESESPTLNWTAGAGVAAQNITAVYLTLQVAPDPPIMLAAFPLDVPLTIFVAGQQFEKIVRYRSYAVPA